MRHEEWIRIVPDANTAVLFLHGICGSPNHFRQLLPLEQTVPESWSLYNMVLDGHCKTVRDFGKTSMVKWQSQVQKAFDLLASTHQHVILVGHSMGTLFSIRLALERPDKIPFLFLLAVPLHVAVKPRAIKSLLQIAFDYENEEDYVLSSMRNACGITQTKKLWQYIPWVMRIVELLQLCRKISKVVQGLTVPCIALQSTHDEMVSRRSDALLKRCHMVECIELKRSTHFYYSPHDCDLVLERFRKACGPYL